jgi:calcineurin-like phosphoesterase family protein
MTTWYTSDLHFNHKRITELTERGQFTDAEGHTEWLIDLWNSQVKRGDTVWHLGDFNFSSRFEDWAKVLHKLNGKINLIKGNHDDMKIMKSAQLSSLVTSVQDYKEVKTNGNTIVLFHFPIQSWNKQGYGSIHAHGHCHGSLPDSGGKRLDVGLDNAWNIFGKHQFFSEEFVLEYMLQRDVKVQDHHKDHTKEPK